MAFLRAHRKLPPVPTPPGVSASIDACRRACREHPVTMATAGVAVIAGLALLCIGLRHHD